VDQVNRHAVAELWKSVEPTVPIPCKNPMQLQLPGFEREADSPKLLKTITTQRMESLEGVDVLAKQKYCMEFMET